MSDPESPDSASALFEPVEVASEGPGAWWAVAVGGACGALARHAIVQASSRVGIVAPFAIGSVNVLGCFAAGALWGWLDSSGQAPWLKPLAMTGFLGAFTTFSAFGKETVELFTGGRPALAIGSVLLQVGLGLAAVAVGRAAFA